MTEQITTLMDGGLIRSSKDDEGELPRAEVPAFLKQNYGFKLSATTLETYASRGIGPVYRRKSGQVRYEIRELRKWAEDRISSPSAKAADHKRAVAA